MARLRIRKVKVEKWPKQWRDRLALALFLVWLRLRYGNHINAWLLLACLAALAGLMLVIQSLGH